MTLDWSVTGLGRNDGPGSGVGVGVGVGDGVGVGVGAAVGPAVGAGVGAGVGAAVGAVVGAGVGPGGSVATVRNSLAAAKTWLTPYSEATLWPSIALILCHFDPDRNAPAHVTP